LYGVSHIFKALLLILAYLEVISVVALVFTMRNCPLSFHL